MEFAKIIVVDGQQVLFYLSPDNEKDDCETLNQCVRIDGVFANVAISGFSYANADRAFAKADETIARVVLGTVRNLLGEKS